MINFSVLESIKQSEGDHQLSILVINNALNIPLENLMNLQSFGKITIAVDSPNEASFLIGKLSGFSYKIVLTRRIPIVNYDVLISTTFEGATPIVVKNLKIKYVCFTNFVKNFNLTDYYEFEENSYKLYVDAPNVRPQWPAIPPLPPLPHPHPMPPPPSGVVPSGVVPSGVIPHPPVPPDSLTPPEGNVGPSTNPASEYEMIIKDIAPYDVKYGKYTINYVHPVVPGKVSIIMIVSTINNKFAETLSDLRAQNVASIEYVIIDNAAGFRNNVKPNIRYGERMPIDFCEYHAKELTTGEFIFIMYEDTDPFDIMTAINQGKYETR